MDTKRGCRCAFAVADSFIALGLLPRGSRAEKPNNIRIAAGLSAREQVVGENQ
jgi:hypothetical protein